MSAPEAHGYGPVWPSESIEAALRALGEELSVEAPEQLPRLRDLLPEGELNGDLGGAHGPDTSILFPEVDFDRHPYYRDMSRPDDQTRARAAERFFEAFCPLVRAELAVSKRAFRGGYRSRRPDHARSEAAQALENCGIWRFRLTSSELEEVLDRTDFAAKELEARRQSLSPEQRGVDGVLMQLADHSAPGAEYEFYDDILRSHDVYLGLEEYYGVPFRLLAVNLQINSGEDTSIARSCSFPDGRRASSYYMHIDSGVGLTKILMYRSGPITAQNGAFRYVPASQRALDPVHRAIRKACDKAGLDGLRDEARALFMGLPSCLRRKANYGNDLLAESGVDADALLAREAVLDGEAGEGFLTDVNGAHRGNLHSDPDGRREMFKFVLKASK